MVLTDRWRRRSAGVQLHDDEYSRPQGISDLVHRVSARSDKDGRWSAAPGKNCGVPHAHHRAYAARPAKFNGTVFVEWLNVSAGSDAAADFSYAGAARSSAAGTRGSASRRSRPASRAATRSSRPSAAPGRRSPRPPTRRATARCTTRATSTRSTSSRRSPGRCARRTGSTLCAGCSRSASSPSANRSRRSS